MISMASIRLGCLGGGMSRHSMHQPPTTLAVPLPTSSSILSSTNVDPYAVEYPASHPNAPQTNRLLLLQFGDWDEGQAYDEDSPT